MHTRELLSGWLSCKFRSLSNRRAHNRHQKPKLFHIHREAFLAESKIKNSYEAGLEVYRQDQGLVATENGLFLKANLFMRQVLYQHTQQVDTLTGASRHNLWSQLGFPSPFARQESGGNEAQLLFKEKSEPAGEKQLSHHLLQTPSQLPQRTSHFIPMRLTQFATTLQAISDISPSL